MKRFLAVFASMALVFTLTACGEKNEPITPNQSTDQQGSAIQNPSDDSSAASPGIQITNHFQELLTTYPEKSAEELANDLISLDSIPFDGAVMVVEPGFLNGFTEEISGFSEGAMFGPIINSIPFVGYVFRLEDGSDVDAFMELLQDKADLRWNICTTADEIACVSKDNMVCFVMSPASFAE